MQQQMEKRKDQNEKDDGIVWRWHSEWLQHWCEECENQRKKDEHLNVRQYLVDCQVLRAADEVEHIAYNKHRASHDDAKVVGVLPAVENVEVNLIKLFMLRWEPTIKNVIELTTKISSAVDRTIEV